MQACPWNLGRLKSPEKKWIPPFACTCTPCSFSLCDSHWPCACLPCKQPHGRAPWGPHTQWIQLGTQGKLARCWTGLDFNMKQEFWAVAVILALLEERLVFFHDKTDGNGTLEGNPLHYIINRTVCDTPSLPSGPQEILFPAALQEIYFYL